MAKQAIQLSDGIENEFKIIEADQNLQRALLGISGFTGSGKTHNARMAAEILLFERYKNEPVVKGDEPLFMNIKEGKKLVNRLHKIPEWIAAKIGIIDTENGRATLSNNKIIQIEGYGGYKLASKIKSIPFNAPFTVSRLEAARNTLINAGCEVIIIDSLTHFWEDIKSTVNKMGGQYKDWAYASEEIKKLIRGLFSDNKADTIFCMRAKNETIMETNKAGKTEVKQIGLKSEMKDTLTYELQVDLMLDHKTHEIQHVVKDNTKIFSKGDVITPEHYVVYAQWLQNKINEKEVHIFKIKNLGKKFGNEKILNLKQSFCTDERGLDPNSKFNEWLDYNVLEFYQYANKELNEINLEGIVI